MLKLGVDIGDTSTDATVIDFDGNVVSMAKTATTENPREGIGRVLASIAAVVDPRRIAHAMLGSTQSVRAIQRAENLKRVGVLRISAPAATGITPGAFWPTQLHQAIVHKHRIVPGGHEFDGGEIAPLDEHAIRVFAEECASLVEAIAVAAPFSPAISDHERRAAEIIAEELGQDFPVTLSHNVGALGLIERENAAILNASLLDVIQMNVRAFEEVLRSLEINAEMYLSQNDGTLSSVNHALRHPIFTLGSGMSNAMRGASALAKLDNALVFDVGETSSLLGILIDGFPKETMFDSIVSGVRTNFRMPELMRMPFGVASFDSRRVAEIALACEKLQTYGPVLPLIVVGDGAQSLPLDIPSVRKVIIPEFFEIANAYGAAIADVSGTVDIVSRYEHTPREQVLSEAKRSAIDRAIEAGADPDDVHVSVVSEVPLAYIPGNASRVIVKAVGRLL